MTFRPLPFLTAATVFALVVLVGLGVWQLQRRAEKHALLDQIQSRGEMAPAPVEILFTTGDYAAHRQATARGVFDHAAEIYVFAPRTDAGPTVPGYKVITPFYLDSGGEILVDRGWVPKERKSPETRSKGQPDGEVEITGALRPSARPSQFTPAPDLAARVVYQRDSAAIASAFGLSLKSALIFEAAERVEEGPEPLPANLNIPDNHLNYALTWFSLALILVAVYLRFHHMRGRLKFG
jgi:surfeit locus 1 family protein